MAMSMFALASVPLIKKILSKGATQAWVAEDALRVEERPYQLETGGINLFSPVLGMAISPMLQRLSSSQRKRQKIGWMKLSRILGWKLPQLGIGSWEALLEWNHSWKGTSLKKF